MEKETSPDGVGINTWDSALHGIGKLATARSADGVTVDNTYTEFGKNAATAWTIEGTRYEFRYGYDNIGRLACLSYPLVPGAAERLSVGYFYNPQGHLAQATDGCEIGGRPYWTAEARNGADQLERERYGNGVITTRTYRPDTGLLDRIQTAGPGTIGQLTDIAYDYDANRNVKTRNDQANQRADIYHYDVLNRLDGWSVQSDAGPPSKSTTYAYDVVGNLTTETVQSANQPGTSTIYRYGEQGAPLHALTSLNNQKYGYDHAGQQTSGPNRTVKYNTFGLPTVLNWGIGQGQARRTTFAYGPEGERVIKRDEEQTNITVAGLFERRTPAGTGGKETHNLHNIMADGRVIAQVNRFQDLSGGPVITSRVTYLHADLQDSTIALTNRNGEPSSDDSWLRKQFYEPFGRRINAQNEPVGGDSKRGGPRQGYTGHDHDVEYDLINMTGRIYDPEARRFLTPDPITQNPMASQGHNRYTYVENNPSTLIDPTGWQACDTEISSCQSDSDGGLGGILGGAADCLTDVLTGGSGGGTSEDYHFGRNLITPDGVDDDVSWAEGTTEGQFAEGPGEAIPRQYLEPYPAPGSNGFIKFVAEYIIGEVPPSVVIPFVKDSLLADHFEFSQPGENQYQHAADVLARRWSATGARETQFYYNQVVKVAAAGATAGALVNRVGGIIRGGPYANITADIIAARFAQKDFREGFSQGGGFAGQTIDDVAKALRSGALDPQHVPIDIIVREGNTLILNTRSAQALTRAGIPRALWNVKNVTGNPFFERLLSGQLSRNRLLSHGIELQGW